jgi:hypothetical protein
VLIEASDVLTVLNRGSGKRPGRGEREAESEVSESPGKSDKQERPRSGRRGDQRRERPADDKPPPST